MSRRAVALALSVLAGVASAKPLNPFQGELVPAEVRVRGGTEIGLVLRLTSLEAFPAADVELRTPRGADVVQGRRKLRLNAVAEGSERVLRWRVRVNEPGEQEISVHVRAVGIAPDAASRAFRCVVNPGPPPPPPVVRRAPDGTEYRVHEIPLER